MRMSAAGRTALLALVIAGTGSACDAVQGAIPAGGPIARSVAEDSARLASGISTAPVRVIASRLSTYGTEHPGGTAAKPGDQVWAVTLGGSFPVASCTVQLPVFSFSLSGTPAPAAPAAKPCPPPSARERVLLDAAWGRVLEVLPGG